MNKRKNYLTFLAGMLTTVLLCTCVTTALAASGAVTFNAVNVAFNSMRFSQKGETFKLDSGATIPSSILYTDEKGSSTTYIPLRKFAELFDMHVTWLEDEDEVNVRVDGALEPYTLPLNATGCAINGFFKEIEPFITKDGTQVLAQVDHQ